MQADPAVTQMLSDVRGGSREAFDRLYAIVYDELRAIAHHRLLRHRSSDTLSTTVLVHETYLRLVDFTQAGHKDRSHFLALASRAMRFILVDHARARQAQKRDGGVPPIPLDLVELPGAERIEETTEGLLRLNDALEQLMAVSERQGRIVEYRFFGGLSYEDIAGILDISERTAKRDWTRARAWLYTYMKSAVA